MSSPVFNLKYRSSKSSPYPFTIRKRKNPALKRSYPYIFYAPEPIYIAISTTISNSSFLSGSSEFLSVTFTFTNPIPLHTSYFHSTPTTNHTSNILMGLSSRLNGSNTKPRISRVTTPSKASSPSSPKITGVCASPCGRII